MRKPELRVRSFVRASEDDVRAGLLGYVSASYGTLLLDGITVRRTGDGRVVLSFPARTDGAGRRHPIVRPIDEEARQQIEREILKALGPRLAEIVG
jgi:DNA-binding cell septation regulator SpoVG